MKKFKQFCSFIFLKIISFPLAWMKRDEIHANAFGQCTMYIFFCIIFCFVRSFSLRCHVPFRSYYDFEQQNKNVKMILNMILFTLFNEWCDFFFLFLFRSILFFSLVLSLILLNIRACRCVHVHIHSTFMNESKTLFFAPQFMRQWNCIFANVCSVQSYCALNVCKFDVLHLQCVPQTQW